MTHDDVVALCMMADRLNDLAKSPQIMSDSMVRLGVPRLPVIMGGFFANAPQSVYCAGFSKGVVDYTWTLLCRQLIARKFDDIHNTINAVFPALDIERTYTPLQAVHALVQFLGVASHGPGVKVEHDRDRLLLHGVRRGEPIGVFGQRVDFNSDMRRFSRFSERIVPDYTDESVLAPAGEVQLVPRAVCVHQVIGGLVPAFAKRDLDDLFQVAAAFGIDGQVVVCSRFLVTTTELDLEVCPASFIPDWSHE